jgi:glycine/D-amino acid oxidase-like deaminating enzyme/nitrite reductase/ring-hydroxylating ferredoxin subunit
LTTVPTTPNLSLWLETASPPEYPALRGDERYDAVVVGGGITGLTSALLLQEAGVRTLLLEARRIGGGTTGNTTAKVTWLHGLRYSQLRDQAGAEAAALYAAANRAGLDTVLDLATRHGIDCDLRRPDAMTGTTDRDNRGKVEAEVEAATAAGLQVEMVERPDFPAPIAAAVRAPEQALFHPVKYCAGLARAFTAAGGTIAEGTRALDVAEEDGTVRVTTEHGGVTAGTVIIATLLPFHDPGGCFARTTVSRSYALSATPGRVSPPQAMVLLLEGMSVRAHPVDGGEVLIVEGESHRPGEGGDPEQHYEKVAAWAREVFAVNGVTHRWSAQDYMTHDSVPLVGRAAPGRERTLVATGFNKWGMTGGTAAALMLRDLVLETDNPWLELFDARRAKSATRAVSEAVHVGVRAVADRLHSDADSLESIPPGTGGLVSVDGTHVAAFRDKDGTVRALSPRCTHMGCNVRWNQAELSWDCPCHGSRFQVDGAVIEGPATVPLPAAEIHAETRSTD